MTSLSDHEKTIIGWLADRKGAMLCLLEQVVNIDSGSYDKAGVDAVGGQFEEFFAAHGLKMRRQPHDRFGDAIEVRLDDSRPNARPIVLMGHRDTVFPTGEAGRRPFRIVAGRAYGPGVSDMKAGLVMNAFVLAAFKTCGGAPAPLIGLITADEEVGSPSSRALIASTAGGARAVFNAEPGRPSGNVVTARKGGVFMRVGVAGKPAHSGGNFEAGRSAIGELAHKILALSRITNLARGITVNVGIVRGGDAVNMVAPWAECEVDLRYVEPAHRSEAMAEIERIIATEFVAGTKSTLDIAGEFLPLNAAPESETLFRVYRQAAEDVGLSIAGEFSGGCADSGFAAAAGCPTICGVGPVGGNAHTPEEYLEVDSMVPRAQALALAILALNRR